MTVAAMIVAAALQANVPPKLMLSICYTETRLTDITSPNDKGSPSYGPCQIKLATAQRYNRKLSELEMSHAATSIKYAAIHVARLLRRHGNNWSCTAIAYNHGNASKACPLFDSIYNSKHTYYSNQVVWNHATQPWKGAQ
jgi:hypothetical protein